MDTMMSLTDKYKETRDRESNSKLCQEIEKLEVEYSTAQYQSQEVLVEIKEIANLNKFVRHLESKVPRPSDTSELPAEEESQNRLDTEKVKVHQPIVTVKETDSVLEEKCHYPSQQQHFFTRVSQVKGDLIH